MDKIAELKEQIEAAKQMEVHYKEMWKLYYARSMKLNVDLFFEEMELKFCQTGKFLDE